MGTLKSAIADAHADKQLHSEFWKFVGYTAATVVMVKQGLMAQANWAVVTMFVSYLAIVAGSNIALKVVAMLANRGEQST